MRRKGVEESTGVGHAAAVGEEREAKSQHAGKEQRDSRSQEEGEEAGVGDLKLALLTFLPLLYSCAQHAINL